VCTAAPVNGKDQRGLLRRSDRCSIGSYEADPLVPNALPSPAPTGAAQSGTNPLPVTRPTSPSQNGSPSPMPPPRP
jgi:hypothetical protein